MLTQLGELIREARQKKGLTTTQLAEIVDLSQGYISHLENNRKKNPSPEVLKKISSELEIPLGELLIKAGYEDMTREVLNRLNEELKEKVALYTDEIMTLEIREHQSQKYKLLYDPTFKKQTVEYLVKHYNFDGLTDIGVKSYTRELLEKYLDKTELERKYKPYSNENAIYFAYDELDSLFKYKITDYFRNDDLPVNYFYYLKDDNIKEGLNYELYEKITFIIENAQIEIRNLAKEFE